MKKLFSLTLLTGLFVVAINTSGQTGQPEAPNWKLNQTMSTKKYVTGSHYEQRCITGPAPAFSMYCWQEKVDDVVNIQCCLQSVDNNSCNLTAQNSHCN